MVLEIFKLKKTGCGEIWDEKRCSTILHTNLLFQPGEEELIQPLLKSWYPLISEGEFETKRDTNVELDKKVQFS